MSISALNRSAFTSPLSRTSQTQPDTSVAQRVGGASAQPMSGLRQRLMSDSFEQGSRKLGNLSGDGIESAVKQMSQVLSQLTQLIKSLESPAQAGQGDSQGVQEIGGMSKAQSPAAASSPASPSAAPSPASPEAPAASGAPQAQSPAAASSMPSSPDSAAHPTYNSDAGPGFGPPSAGSTQQASQPWLSLNNVGTPYNSNMQLIDASQKDQFKYTNTFKNTTNQPQTITLWNKTGQNGGPNDGQNFDKSTPKTFTLQPGQSQVVAFDTNSSVAWCVSKDGSAKPGANSGQTWGEATFGNAATGWSGYDVSQIAPGGHNGNMSITNEATGAKVTQANAWQTPSDDPAGHDVGVPAGPLNLSTELG